MQTFNTGVNTKEDKSSIIGTDIGFLNSNNDNDQDDYISNFNIRIPKIIKSLTPEESKELNKKYVSKIIVIITKNILIYSQKNY